MKLKFAVALSCLLGVSSIAFAKLDFQYQDLPQDRSSRDYGAQIKALDKIISGYKWVAEYGTGFTIPAIPNPVPTATSDRAVNGLYFEMNKFKYDKEQVRTMPYELYSRQSERVGYVEFWDDESKSAMHIKALDSNTLEIFTYANESNEKNRMIYKKVARFEKNPNKERLKSASDSGMIF